MSSGAWKPTRRRRITSRWTRSGRFNLFVLLTLLISAGLIGLALLQQNDDDSPGPGELSGDPIATIAVFDVGQALSAAIVTGDGHSLVYDFGLTASHTQEVIMPFLTDHDAEELDFAILSHPHQDHLGGLPELLESIPVSLYIDPVLETTNQTYARSLEIIETRDIPVEIARQGETYALGSDVDFEILWPSDELITHSDGTHNLNENSTVVRVSIGEVTMLLTGDMEREAEDILTESIPEKLDSDILQVAHHGSNSSSQDHFLAAVGPGVAIISAGRDNQYGHPHTEVMQRLRQREIQIFRTDVDGTVIIQTDGETWDITSTRTDQSWIQPESLQRLTASNWTSNTTRSPFWFSIMLSN